MQSILIHIILNYSTINYEIDKDIKVIVKKNTLISSTRNIQAYKKDIVRQDQIFIQN